MGSHGLRLLMSSRRVGLSVLVLIAALLAVGIAATAKSGDRNEGPLQPSSVTTVEFPPLPADQTVTWGSHLPPNRTSSDIVVRSIEAIDPEGLSILGMTMTDPDVTSGMTAGLGYPPAGVATTPVEGSVMSPWDEGGTSRWLQVLIGVRLAEGSESGSIKGLRVRYLADGREYEVVLPTAL